MMPRQSPLISVVIPSYNYGCYLSSAIKSVLEQRGEGFNKEIIVVDDGSSDDTRQVAQSFGADVHYIYQENKGLSEARNTGIRNANGDFLVFLDADDLLGPNTLQSHLETFEKNPHADLSVCHCFCNNVTTCEAFLWPLKSSHLDLHLCHSNIAPVHAIMVRSQTVRDAGLFDSTRKACEDYDYWIRCAGLGKHFVTTPTTFVIYRQHGDSMSGQKKLQYLHDMAARLGIEQNLKTTQKFPQAGPYYGWLAYAAGSLASSPGCACHFPQLARRLLESASQSLLAAAKAASRAPSEDPHILQAERYFAAEIFMLASFHAANFPAAMKKGMLFLASRFPDLAKLSHEQLQAKNSALNRRMVGDCQSILPELQQYRHLKD